MEKRMSDLLESSQVTSPHRLDESSLATLQAILSKERATLLATAARLSSDLTGVPTQDATQDPVALQLACSFHQLLHPPLRHHSEYHASVVNALSPTWPVSGQLSIPLASAQASGGLLVAPEIMPKRMVPVVAMGGGGVGGGGGGGGGDGAGSSGSAGALPTGPVTLPQVKKPRPGVVGFEE